MAKIIQLKTKKDNVLQLLDEIKEWITQDKLDVNSMLFVGKLDNQEIILAKTGNMNVGTMLELNGHIQMQAIKNMIEENYVN